MPHDQIADGALHPKGIGTYPDQGRAMLGGRVGKQQHRPDPLDALGAMLCRQDRIIGAQVLNRGAPVRRIDHRATDHARKGRFERYARRGIDRHFGVGTCGRQAGNVISARLRLSAP